MTFLFSLVFVVFGLVLLVFGADWLVAGASRIAKRFGIPAIVIGLTVVAFGTSLPELAVNLFSAFQGKGDVAIGNVLGSNIANILLILGASSLLFPLVVKRATALKEIPIAAGAVVVFILCALDGTVSIGDGILFLFLSALFLYYAYRIGDVSGEAVLSADEYASTSFLRNAFVIVAGLALLLIGGMITVEGAVALAELAGVSDRIIALTIVAVGTSFPELFTSLVAAYRKQADIAIGNVVGSNILNILVILGVTATIQPLPFSSVYAVDALLVLFATVLLFVALFVGKKYLLERWQGGLFLALYAVYILWLVVVNL